MRLSAFAVLVAVAQSALGVDARPVRVRLQPVVRESSVAWELLDFLDTKVIQYRLVADEPVTRLTAKITFRLRDSSGKLAATNRLDGGCMYTHAMTSATLTFLLSREKAFVSVDGSSERIATDFLQRVSGKYHYWKPSPGLEDREHDKIDVYAVYCGGKKLEADKTASIELEVSGEAL
jgi:hypothetical protein